MYEWAISQNNLLNYLKVYHIRITTQKTNIIKYHHYDEHSEQW